MYQVSLKHQQAGLPQTRTSAPMADGGEANSEFDRFMAMISLSHELEALLARLAGQGLTDAHVRLEPVRAWAVAECDRLQDSAYGALDVETP